MQHLAHSIHQLGHLNLQHKHQCLFHNNSNHQLKLQHISLNKTHLFQIKVSQKCTTITIKVKTTLTKTCQDNKTTIITIQIWDSNNNLTTNHHHNNTTLTTIKEETIIKVVTSIKDRTSIKVDSTTVECTKTKITITHTKVVTKVITKTKIKVTIKTKITNKRGTITTKEDSNINQETNLINGNHLNLMQSLLEKNIKIER